MNVMAKAHKMVKGLLAKITARYVGQYAAMLKVALKDAHKEAKSMKNDMLARLNARLEKLKMILNSNIADRYMVTCDNLPINMESGRTTNIENASNWASRQFAEANAVKVKNGRGTQGVAVLVRHQAEYEMQNVCHMINELV